MVYLLYTSVSPNCLDVKEIFIVFFYGVRGRVIKREKIKMSVLILNEMLNQAKLVKWEHLLAWEVYFKHYIVLDDMLLANVVIEGQLSETWKITLLEESLALKLSLYDEIDRQKYSEFYNDDELKQEFHEYLDLDLGSELIGDLLLDNLMELYLEQLHKCHELSQADSTQIIRLGIRSVIETHYGQDYFADENVLLEHIGNNLEANKI